MTTVRLFPDKNSIMDAPSQHLNEIVIEIIHPAIKL